MDKGKLKGTNEILTILNEECGEVIQASCKMQRFGDKANTSEFEKEVGDLLAMIMLMADKGIVDERAIWTGCINKLEKLKKWSNISGLDKTINKINN